MNEALIKGGPRSGVPASCGDAVPAGSALPRSTHSSPAFPRSTPLLSVFEARKQRSVYMHTHTLQGDKVSKSIKST
jgi:hypothetical protein